MPWRPSNISNMHPEAAHVVNQLFRETNGRIDDLLRQQRPHIRSTSILTFGSIPATTAVESIVNIPGANTSGTAHASPAQGLNIGNVNLIWSARVVGQGQVAIRVLNPTSSPIAVNTIPWNVSVLL